MVWGQGSGQLVSLERFELEPTTDLEMETVEESFMVSGKVAMELSTRNPRETVGNRLGLP